jgi:hypothetical protein
LSYFSALVCDPSAGSGLRHPHGAGTARAQRREYDNDIPMCSIGVVAV